MSKRPKMVTPDLPVAPPERQIFVTPLEPPPRRDEPPKRGRERFSRMDRLLMAACFVAAMITLAVMAIGTRA
jgi:hypothetical protein